MARGYSTSRSEARSPEVLKVREAMKSKEGVDANTAMMNDPTLKEFMLSDKFDNELQERISQAVGRTDFNPDEDGTSSYTVDGTTSVIKIGNRFYEIKTPDINVDVELEDTSFDHAFGTQEDFEVKSLDHDFEGKDGVFNFLEETKIRLLDGPPKGYVIDSMPKGADVKSTTLKLPFYNNSFSKDGVTEYVPFKQHRTYRDLTRPLNGMAIDPDAEGLKVIQGQSRQSRYSQKVLEDWRVVDSKGRKGASYGSQKDAEETLNEANKALVKIKEWKSENGID